MKLAGLLLEGTCERRIPIDLPNWNDCAQHYNGEPFWLEFSATRVLTKVYHSLGAESSEIYRFGVDIVRLGG